MNRFLISFVTFIVTLAIAVPLVLLSFNWYEQLLIESLWWHVTLLLIAGMVALLFWAFRDKIFHKLRLTTKTALEDVADPLIEMVNKLIGGNGEEASAQAKIFVRRFLSRYASIKSMAWIVGTVFGFLAIFATMAASAILIKQNSIILSQNALIESQNKYFQEQNQKIQLQIDNQLNEERNARRSKLIEILYEEATDQANNDKTLLGLFGLQSNINVSSKVSNHGSQVEYFREQMQEIGGDALQNVFNENKKLILKIPKYNLRSRNEAFSDFIKIENDDGKNIVNLNNSILDGLNLSDWNHENHILLDLSHSQIRRGYFENCDFSDCDFNFANLEGCEFFDSNLTGVELDGVNLPNANLTFSVFSKVNMKNANLSNSTLQGVAFKDANLGYSNLSGSVNIGFNKGDILSYSKAGHVTLFSQASMIESNINNAYMTYVIFHKVDLTNSTLSKTNYDGSIFDGSVCAKSDLSNSSLRESVLLNTSFKQANLKGVIFNSAILENVSFVRADLRNASFESVLFNQVDFDNATVDSIDWFDRTAEVSSGLSKIKLYWTIEEAEDANGEKCFVIKKDRTVARKPTYLNSLTLRPSKDAMLRIQGLYSHILEYRGIEIKSTLSSNEPMDFSIMEAPAPPKKKSAPLPSTDPPTMTAPIPSRNP